MNSKFYLFLPYLSVIILSTLHLCQGIVFSGADKIPGDLGDARLVNLILEHNWQSFNGKQNLISPSQFYPKQHTIFYSHNLWGTTAFYGFFRMFGISIETSYQCWFVLICSLNSICFLFLLKNLNITNLLAIPLTVVGVASGALVYKSVHPQLLAIFPFLLSLAFLLDFIKKPREVFLVTSVVFYVFQHFCSIYQGFFSTLILITFIIFYAIFCRNSMIGILSFVSEKKRIVISTFAIGVLCLSILYFPYYLHSKVHGIRCVNELKLLSPEFGSWFSANPFSFLYSQLNFISEEQGVVWEKMFFSGFTGYIFCGFFFIFFIIKKPQLNSDLKVAISLIFTFITLFILVTNLNKSDFNLWIWITEYIEPLRSIRAFGRIFILLTSIQVIALAILLNYCIKRFVGIKLVKPFIFIIPLIFVLESLSIGQPLYSKKTAQERVFGLKENFQNINDINAFVFAPGIVLNPVAVHLDAWNLSLITGVPCLNGYSGNSPKSHAKFLISPTKSNALELMQRRLINPKEIAIIENRIPIIENKYPLVRYDLDRVRIHTYLKALECSRNQEFFLECEIENPSQNDIPAMQLSFYPSYRLYHSDGILVEDLEPLRTSIEVLRKESSTRLNLKVHIPNERGDYLLKPCFVRENVEWMVDVLPEKELSNVKIKVN